MTVLASGDASFDLSLLYVLTISTLISVVVVIGCVNGLLAMLLRMPAMVASPSVGCIVYSAILFVGGHTVTGVSKGLGDFLGFRLAGVPVVLLIGVAIDVLERVRLCRRRCCAPSS